MNDKVTIKNRLRRLLDPIVGLLVKAGISPTAVTVAGFVLSLAGAVAIARGSSSRAP